jgi:pimeloyl-ACP methyl ester carboxylesterase
MPFTRSTPFPLFFRADGPSHAAPLLLLHGGPGAHHDYLYPQMLELAKQHRVITYDQRGGGKLRVDGDEPVTWQSHVEDLALIVRELSLEPLTLVGYSWGGLLAMLYAIEATKNPALPAPQRLVLISPAPITREWRDEFEAALAERQRSEAIAGARQALLASGLREQDADAYKQRSFELSVAGYFADPARAVSLTPFRVMGKVQKSVWESLGRYDLCQSLRAVRCPALVVHGDADPIPMASAQAAADALGARFVALADCGHVPYVEQPAALFGAIEQFLGDTTVR